MSKDAKSAQKQVCTEARRPPARVVKQRWKSKVPCPGSASRSATPCRASFSLCSDIS